MSTNSQDCSGFAPGSYIYLNIYDWTETDAEGVIKYEMCPIKNGTGCNSTQAYAIEHPLGMGHDLAVIILPEGRPATGIPYVRLNRNIAVPEVDQELETFGWGSTTYGDGPYPNAPLTAKFRYVPPQECADIWGGGPDNKTLCAHAEGSAVGGGDSGTCILLVFS